MFNQLKAFILLGALSGIFLLMGYWVGGQGGALFAFMMALGVNFFTYYFSDSLVLGMYGAVALDEVRYKHIHTMVDELCRSARIPKPRLWIVKNSIANAFATGRNPQNASVAVTQGILDLLNEDELRGVLAHEISHIKNRDILVGTVAAVLATAIGYIANMIQWMFIFDSRRTSKNSERSGGIGALFVALIMPIAATLVQLAISRSREFLADESGAKCSKDPLALAVALEKLHVGVERSSEVPPTPAHAAAASLFIVYPFSGSSLVKLFSTHPPMEERIRRLRAMARRGS